MGQGDGGKIVPVSTQTCKRDTENNKSNSRLYGSKNQTQE